MNEFTKDRCAKAQGPPHTAPIAENQNRHGITVSFVSLRSNLICLAILLIGVHSYNNASCVWMYSIW
jgi:hypothetical protein